MVFPVFITIKPFHLSVDNTVLDFYSSSLDTLKILILLVLKVILIKIKKLKV
jgi:hypothetical protein